MSLPKRYRTSGVYVLVGAAGAFLVAALMSIGGSVNAQTTETPADLRARALMRTNSLKIVQVSDAATFDQFVRDRVALRKLGKALFWDQQIGSDGQACASCHFHAGADNRSLNQLNPGFRDQTPGVDTHAFTPPFRSNYQLTAADFPFHRLLDVNNRASKVTFDTNDVASSQGVFNAEFTKIGIPGDQGVPSLAGNGAVFNVNGVLVRNVEPRNTPTVINAVLNRRNFWDGRARFEFNGVNPFGALDADAKVVRVLTTPSGQAPKFQTVRITRSSAASQADGPPLSDLEMSFFGRRFPEVGRKMLDPALVALGQQKVAPTDSLLGASANLKAGISLKYSDLIRQAFLPDWWDAPGWVVDLTIPSLPLITPGTPGPDRFTVLEFNFSLFFGMAVNEYEKTLIADDTPFDRFMEGNLTALTAAEQRGLVIFLDQGKCIRCHSGPELTNASLTNVQRPEIIERMIMGDNRVAVYDNGFYNIGVRPTLEDIGVGGKSPSNLPLSDSRFFQMLVRDEVKRLMAADPTLTRAAAVRRANTNPILEIPRILARPEEAARLLLSAAALLGNPPDIVSLIAQANTLLAAVPPDPTGASKLLVQARDFLVLRASGAKVQVAVRTSVLNLTRAATSLLPDPIDPGPDPLQPLGPPLDPDERVAVDGALKTPTVRGVALTAPYFHNGGQLTLRQVVDFYNRGGDFAVQNQQNLDPDIQPLFLTDAQKTDLVAFLKSLTDVRVVFDRAPFDHPSLNVPNGGSGVVTLLFGFPVMDDRIVLPAVGAAGNAIPLGTLNMPFANFPQPLK